MTRSALVLACLIASACGSLATPAGEAEAGRGLFGHSWSPAGTDGGDGLGPLFNEVNCAGCHDGGGSSRFTALATGEVAARGLVARLGDAAGDPDPHYGRQIQTQAVAGLGAEGIVRVGRAVDGPSLRVSVDLHGPPLAPGVAIGYRQAPSLAGRAHLAAVPDTVILSLADPDDGDGDGISGRARLVGTVSGFVPGRFGWKAAAPGLADQVAAALAVDMGLATSLVPAPAGDCTAAQRDCLTAAGRPQAAEVSSEDVLDLVAFLGSLPPPAPVDDPDGAALFAATGCAGCHRPLLPDQAGNPVVAYTDFLLHDLGPDLDDGVGEPGVPSFEWRTAPLIDLGPQVGRRYLHDGRAASLLEAIARHGGEAAATRDRFLDLAAGKRDTLLRFLEDL